MVFKMYYKDDFQICVYNIFWTLQDVWTRCLACLDKTSLRHLADVFLATVHSQQTITCSKVATETQKQLVKTN